MPRQAKAKAEPAPATRVSDAGTVLNKAKAAFDEYRKKITGAASNPGNECQTGKTRGRPPAGPFPMFPMPGWGAPAAPAPGSPWPGVVWPGGGPGPMSGPATAAPFAESVGQMLRMGVAFATAALAGGLQVMEGFAGPGRGPSPWPGSCPHGSHPECECGCHPGCGDECGCGCDCDCGHACACCCEQTDCCRVGVHNCRCGC